MLHDPSRRLRWALSLLGLCAPLMSHACYKTVIQSGETVTNTDPLGCVNFVAVQPGGIFNNAAGLLVAGYWWIPQFAGLHIGGVLNNLAGATIDNREIITIGGTVNNDGRITNRSYFQVWGSFTNGVNSYLYQAEGPFYSFGAFTNHGEFRNIGLATFGGGGGGRGVLRNTGVLHNAGTLDFTSETYFFLGRANGDSLTYITDDNASLVNAGQILNDFSGSLLLDNLYGSLDFTGGRLINRGYLRMRGNSLQMGDARSGTLDLLAQGTADFDTLVIGGGYRQLNAGLLRIGEHLQVSGTLQNEGTITVRGLVNIDTRENRLQHALINNGQLHIDDQVGNTPFGARLLIDHQGLLENNGSLRIAASSTFDNRLSTFVNKGDFTNAGQIINDGGYFETTASGRFTLDGRMDNIEGGNVIFAAGSITTGTGHYRQAAGSTQLDGRVEIATFEIAGGRLCGSGFLNGSLLMSGGALCPGNSPGSLHIGGDVAFLGGTLQLEIAGTAAGLYDVLQVDGALSFAAGVVLDVAFIGGYVPQAGDRWSMLNVGGTTTGLAGLDLRLSGLPAGYSLALDGSGALTLQLAAVPEPGSALLMLVGLCGLVGVALRRQVGQLYG